MRKCRIADKNNTSGKYDNPLKISFAENKEAAYSKYNLHNGESKDAKKKQEVNYDRSYHLMFNKWR